MDDLPTSPDDPSPDRWCHRPFLHPATGPTTGTSVLVCTQPPA